MNLSCRVQHVSNTKATGLTREINRPKMRRGMEKFKRDEIVSVVVTDTTSHAANGVFIGLKVGQNELLESDDVS